MMTGINFCSWGKGRLICRNLLIFVAFKFMVMMLIIVKTMFFSSNADNVNMMMGITLELMVSSDLNLSNKASSTEIISGGI